MLGKQRRLAVMAEGSFTPMDAKTALGVLRYRTSEVVAVIDSGRAGRTCDDCVGVGGDIPVVAGLEAAAAHDPDSLLLGIAPQGGSLPESWRRVVAEALLRGWDVLSGLHAFLNDDPELSALAHSKGCTIHDVRRPPAVRSIAARRAASTDALIVLTVGSDCNVGKMTTALEVNAELQGRGIRSAFVATGQTGIFVADHGAAIAPWPSTRTTSASRPVPWRSWCWTPPATPTSSWSRARARSITPPTRASRSRSCTAPAPRR